MPPRTPRPCLHHGCSGLTIERNGYCDQHRNTKWEDHQGSRSTTTRGYGAPWQRLRRLVIRRDNGLCQQCLRQGVATQGKDVDHITPKARGGSDEESNLEFLCAPCHATKTALE